MVIGIDGVAGTAIGFKDGKSCVKVYLEREDPRLRAKVPSSHEGVKVEVEVMGKVRRRPADRDAHGSRRNRTS